MFDHRFHTRMVHGGRVVANVTWHEDPATPAERVARSRSRRRCLVLTVLVLAIAAVVWWRIVPEVPRDYTSITDHFKYGSVGTEMANGIPFRIWKVLPDAFPEYLPNQGRDGYGALGFVIEPDDKGRDREIPIGFSVRRINGVERVSINCAACHTSTYRESAGTPRKVVLGMPAHRLDLLSYFDFLFRCTADGRFNTNDLLARIEAQQGPLGLIECMAYRVAIPITKEEVLRLRGHAQFMLDHPSGPGRIDTFAPYKLTTFGFPNAREEAVGTADFPSIWNQGPREGLNLHWDGNNTSVHERNISAALGAGATPVSIDLHRLKRIENWLVDLPAPDYPWAIDAPLARQGEPLYRKHCADCHGVHESGKFVGARVGQVEPIDRIKTDRERLDSYTLELAENQYTLGAGTRWRFNHFRKTNGYANLPLDGIWARAPYLHNGSVPTLRDLLDAPDKRPKTFYRGYDVYDRKKVGFVSDVAEENGLRFFKFDTSPQIKGNGNGGHEYGIDLSDTEKDALVEYLKQL